MAGNLSSLSSFLLFQPQHERHRMPHHTRSGTQSPGGCGRASRALVPAEGVSGKACPLPLANSSACERKGGAGAAAGESQAGCVRLHASSTKLHAAAATGWEEPTCKPEGGAQHRIPDVVAHAHVAAQAASFSAAPASVIVVPHVDLAPASDAPPPLPSDQPSRAASSPENGVEEEEADDLAVYRGLVLDCSYRPINVVCWKRALCLEIADKAHVLEYYDAVVRSTTQTFPIPAVLRVSQFVHTPKQMKRKLSLSRNNIFLRDKFKCQYCGSRENLTIDHVKALSRGGGSTWENLVTACSPCNLKKGDKSTAEAGMKLMSKPKEPRELNSWDLPPNYRTYRSLARGRATPPQWLDWLPLQQTHPF